ncbi:hypothetical protein HY640_00825 [Candidatus Woesearchaeota archaeon]|nr:hypothetical protein [Candidatus Woesearchaeota archaeon]
MKAWFWFAVVVSFAVLSLLSPFAARYYFGMPLVSGSEPYYHLRIIRGIAEGSLSASDTLVYEGRPYFFGPFHVVLGYLWGLFGEWAVVSFLFLCGLVAFVFFYLLLARFGFSDVRVVSCLIVAASPAFIGTFSSVNPNAIVVPLYMVGFYALLARRFAYVGFVLLVLTAVFGFFNVLLLLVFLVGYLSFERRRMAVMFAVTFFSLFAVFAHYALFSAQESFGLLASRFVTDLGGDGFGAFAFVLFGSGVIFSWRNRYRYALLYCLTAFLVASAFLLGSFVSSYLVFPMGVFSGMALCAVFRRKWEFPLIGRLAALIILCGLLFSSVSFVARLSGAGPDQGLVQALSWLREQPQGLVLSDESYGFWVQYFANKPVLVDGFIASDFRKRSDDAHAIFYSRNLETTRSLLARYGVRYVLIDESMRQGIVWTRNDEGLLFLLRNNETFSQEYSSSGVEVWAVRGT